MSPPPQDDFGELYRAHGGRLVVRLYAYTQELALAEDLVDEAFCRRWTGGVAGQPARGSRRLGAAVARRWGLHGQCPRPRWGH